MSLKPFLFCFFFPHFLFLYESSLYIHRHANKLKGQFCIPSALQQTICCSLNDSCLAREQVWLPLCNTRVCCWHSGRYPQLRAALPAHGQPMPCPVTLGDTGKVTGSGVTKSSHQQETFPPVIQVFSYY